MTGMIANSPGKRNLVRRLVLGAVCAVSVGCIPMVEIKGDMARRKGDLSGARKQYESALRDTLLMDFEYERIQAKWRSVTDSPMEEPFRQVRLKRASQPLLQYTLSVLEFRQQIRDSGVSRELAARVDAYVLECIAALGKEPITSAEVPIKLKALMDFRDKGVGLKMDQSMIDATNATMGQVATTGFLAPSPEKAFDELLLRLELQKEFRERLAPGSVDLAMIQAVQQVIAITPAQLSPELADGRFEAAVKLRTLASAQQGGKATDDYILKAMTEAGDVLMARADADIARNLYVPAYRRMSTVVKSFPANHPYRERLKSLLTRAASYHKAQADALSATPEVALFHLSLVRAFQGASELSLWQSARGALAPKFETRVAFKPEVDGCVAYAQRLSEQILKSKGTPLRLQLQLDACSVDAQVTPESRTIDYTTEESYVEIKRQLVRTELVQVQTGTKQYQCTRPSSLGPEVVWSGLCTEPTYETKQVPVYEDVQVTSFRDVQKSLSYTARVSSLNAVVSGTATVIYEDGTPLTIPIKIQQSRMDDEFAYTIPPRYVSKPSTSTPVSKRLPSSFTGDNVLAGAVETAGFEVMLTGTKAVQAHRAKLARAKGDLSATAGDTIAAEGAYVLSILLNDEVVEGAARWFEKTYGIDTGLCRELLSYSGATLGLPPEGALPGPVAYAPAAVNALSDGYLNSTRALEINFTPQILSGGNTKRGTEAARTHVQLIALDHKNVGGDPDRYAAYFGFETRGALLANLLRPGWGLTVFDEGGFTGAVGGLIEDVAEYQDEWGSVTDRELRYSWLLRADYSLMPGIRLHYISVFAGANAGLFYARSGDTSTLQFHAEPAARVGLRFFGPGQVILTAWGWQRFGPVPGSDGASLSIPFGRSPVDVTLHMERFSAPTRQKDVYAEWQELGDVEVWQTGILLGIRG